MTARRLSHLNEAGEVRMVDVSAKAVAERSATAEGFVSMAPETLDLILSGDAPKGDVLATARIAGIMAAVDDETARELAAAAHDLGMDALAEVHNEAELDRALALDTRLIGINNRDLKSFVTDLAVTEALVPRVPKDRIVIAESGVFTHEDVTRHAGAGVGAFLVGESLMRQSDVAGATRALLTGVPAKQREAAQ